MEMKERITNFSSFLAVEQLCLTSDAKTSGYAPVNPAASETLPARGHILQVANQHDMAYAQSVQPLARTVHRSVDTFLKGYFEMIHLQE